ncbi:hypothetical protein ACIRPU_41120 [Streptomyces sp. NPDC102259]|uniref:hypothetical protein n=1 Tax=Streptomyces sp. NPDC102259 TaxID=3366148 RepID=UPI0038292007
MNTPTLPSHALSGLTAGGSALAHAPWWIVLPLLLPTTAAAINALVTTYSTARTDAMRRRHLNALLTRATEAADYTTGLDHLARTLHAAPPPPPEPPPPEPPPQTPQSAEPPTPPP